MKNVYTKWININYKIPLYILEVGRDCPLCHFQPIQVCPSTYRRFQSLSLSYFLAHLEMPYVEYCGCQMPYHHCGHVQTGRPVHSCCSYVGVVTLQGHSSTNSLYLWPSHIHHSDLKIQQHSAWVQCGIITLQLAQWYVNTVIYKHSNVRTELKWKHTEGKHSLFMSSTGYIYT